MENIINSLHELQELFPTKFSEMKWILGYLKEMKIPLKPDTKLMKQRSYRLNLWYKERVKDETYKMLGARIIKLVEEWESINPIVTQDKKIGEFRIYIVRFLALI